MCDPFYNIFLSPTLLNKVAQKIATIICVTYFTIYSDSPNLPTKVPFVGPNNKNNKNLSNVITGFFQGKPVTTITFLT